MHFPDSMLTCRWTCRCQCNWPESTACR